MNELDKTAFLYRQSEKESTKLTPEQAELVRDMCSWASVADVDPCVTECCEVIELIKQKLGLKEVKE